MINHHGISPYLVDKVRFHLLTEHHDDKFHIFQVSNGTILGNLIEKIIIANVLLKGSNWEKKYFIYILLYIYEDLST